MSEPKYITLTDQSRNREIPCKLYLPEELGSSAVVIFSHGLGGSMDSYQYLGEHLASLGFLAVHTNHDGIDAKLLKEPRPFKAIKEAASEESNITTPALDVKFVLDWLHEQNDYSIDTSKIGLAGHSWGAFTTLQLAGQKHTSKGVGLNNKDARIVAAACLSPSAPKIETKKAFSEIDIPILHLTGTKDDSPVGLTTPEDRQLPYKHMNNSDQYLIVFEDGDHMVFAAQRMRNKFSALDIRIMQSTAAAVGEFFKKYLLQEQSAIDSDEFYASLTATNTNQRKSS